MLMTFNFEEILKINQVIQLELFNAETGESTRFSSRIENILEDSLVLSAPMVERKPLFFKPGTAFNVWFWNEEAIYVFRTYLSENIKGEIPYLVVTFPETIKRVQKREYVRVGLKMNVLLSFYNSKGEEEVFYCKSRDISGGGMMLVLNTYVPLDKGTKIMVKFSLEQRQLAIPGKVVWNEWELDFLGREQNLIGIQFIEIKEIDRKTIIKAVYQRQIELRKKGLL